MSKQRHGHQSGADNLDDCMKGALAASAQLLPRSGCCAAPREAWHQGCRCEHFWFRWLPRHAHYAMVRCIRCVRPWCQAMAEKQSSGFQQMLARQQLGRKDAKAPKGIRRRSLQEHEGAALRSPAGLFANLQARRWGMPPLGYGKDGGMASFW